MVPKEFQARLLGVGEMAQWVRDNTDLQEVSPGEFLIHEAFTGIMGEEVPAKYLSIE